MTGNPMHPELSRPFQVEDLGDKPSAQKIVSTERERAALASRYGVVELRSIGADLTISAAGTQGVRVEGKATAELVQTCVVTLEPVVETIREPVGVTFFPESDEALEDVEMAAWDEEEIDVLEGESLDLGELVAQTIATAIDPYPRKDGAEFGKAPGLGDNEDGVRENPFAALRDLKPADGNAEKG